MKPRSFSWTATAIAALAAFPFSAGCKSLFNKPEEDPFEAAMVDDLGEGPRLIKSLTTPWGIHPVQVKGVGLVTQLRGTGSDPPLSGDRTALLADMKSYDVKKPNSVLAMSNTAMVHVRGFLPPGVQKGDRFDIEVRAPSRSKTTSLKNGWLMPARLREMAVLDNATRTGHVEGRAEGTLILDSAYQGGGNKKDMIRGRILGGGISYLTRPLGLKVRTEKNSIRAATLIGSAVNSRFHLYSGGSKKGVATPKSAKFVELTVHPRYKNNLDRFIRVVRNIAIKESAAERVNRIEQLERMLLEPTTAISAALQLEAIGEETAPVLRKGLLSSDPRVRFYAAEALAYLDQADAAGPLAEAARSEPAFRWHAIAALAVMDHISAYEALGSLLNMPSAETRYAAFQALRKRNPTDHVVRGELLDAEFYYHVVASNGPPLIHFSRFKRAEMVVFGREQRMQPPAFLYAGKHIMLKGVGPDRIKVTRFAPGEADRHETCTTRLDDIVRTIVKLDGSYADVIQAFQTAKKNNYIAAKVVINATPDWRRQYRKDSLGISDSMNGIGSAPLPDMFNNPLQSEGRSERNNDEMSIDISPTKEKGLWDRMTGWFSGDDKDE